MTPAPCGAAHPGNPDYYCNLVVNHDGPHYCAYSYTEWNNTDDR